MDGKTYNVFFDYDDGDDDYDDDDDEYDDE